LPPAAALHVVDSEARVAVAGKPLRRHFRQASRHPGLVAGQEHRADRIPAAPDFWRAPTDNDRGRNMAKSQGVWRQAHLEAQLTRFAAEAESSQRFVVRAAHTLPKVNATWETTYTVLATAISSWTRGSCPDSATRYRKIPRVGMQMVMPPALSGSLGSVRVRRRPISTAGTPRGSLPRHRARSILLGLQRTR